MQEEHGREIMKKRIGYMNKMKKCFFVVVTIIFTLLISLAMVSCDNGKAAGDEASKKATVEKADKSDETVGEEPKQSESTEESGEDVSSDESSKSVSEEKNIKNNNSKAKTAADSSAKKTTQTQAKSTCYISIDGYCSNKSIEVKSGDSVYSILMRSGASVSGSSSYVRGINGLFEFDKGPQSGWKYSVNGSTPGVGCGSYKVKAGDRIRWYYVTKL